MIIVTHVVIALLGLLQATFGLIFPSQGKVRLTYLLTAATFISGGYLVWHLHSPVLQSCMSGLMYLAFILAATFVTQRRLAHARVSVEE